MNSSNHQKPQSAYNRVLKIRLAAAVVVGLTLAEHAVRANTPLAATAADLSQPASYNPARLPTDVDDLLLDGGVTTFDLPGVTALTVGSINNPTSASVALTNTGVGYATLTLGGPGSTVNGSPGAGPADLIFAAGDLRISPTTTQYKGTGFIDLSLGRDGGFSAAAGKTLSLTSAIRTNGHTLTIGGTGVVQIFTPGGGTNSSTGPVNYGLADAGGISGSGGLTVATNGTASFAQLYGRNSYTGVTTINSGAGLGVIGSIDSSSAIINNGSLGFARRAYYTVSQIITGTGEVGIGGTEAARVTLNAANAYTGATRVDWGTLNATKLANGGAASSIGASSSDAFNLHLGKNAWYMPGGGTLRYVGGAVSTDRLFTSEMAPASSPTYYEISSLVESSGTGPLTFTNTGAIAFDTVGAARVVSLGGTNSDVNTFAPSIADNGTGVVNFAKNGSGTWKLTGNNTYTGTTNVNNGLLIAGSAASLGTGLIQVGEAGAIGTEFPLTTAFLSRLRGSGAVVLSADSAANLALATSGSIMLGAAPGTTVSFSGTPGFAGDYRFGGGGGTLIVTRPLTSGFLQIGSVSNFIGSGFPASLPSSTVALAGANTFAGGTTINSGILRMDNATALGTGGVTIKTGGTLVPFADIDQTLVNRIANTSLGSLALRGDSSANISFANAGSLLLGAYTTATYSGTLTPSGAAYYLGGGGGTLNFNSDLTGNRTLIIKGNGLYGKVVLNGNNTYTSGTTVADSRLKIGSDTGLPANTSLAMNGHTDIDLGGRTIAVSGLSLLDSNGLVDSAIRNGSLTVGTTRTTSLRPTTFVETGLFDLSGLTRFAYATPASPGTTLTLGFAGNNASTEGPASVKLAAQNELNAQTLVLGGLRSTNFDLGTSNVLNGNTITLGKQGSASTLYTMTDTQFRFAAGAVQPTLKIRNATGTGAATTVTLANGGQATTTVDLTGGTADVLASTFNVGSSGSVHADSVATVRSGGPASVWNLGTLTVGTVSGLASSTGVGIQTFSHNAGLVLADKVRFNNDIGGTPGAYETLLSTYELGSADSPATLSINAVSIGSTEVTTKSRSTLKFNNGRIEPFDPTRTALQTATGAQPAMTATIAGGVSVFNAQDDRRVLHIELADTGTHTFAAQAGRTLAIDSTATLEGPGGLSIEGPGTVSLAAANTYAGTTTVESGILFLLPAAQDVIFNGGGADIRGGRLSLMGSPDSTTLLSQVRGLLVAGYASQFSTGPLRSSTATAARGLGYGDIAGGGNTTIQAALYGDADLDGAVDFNDFLALQNSFNTSAGAWMGGDFNYDGVTDFNDFLALQNNFGQSISGSPVAFSASQLNAMRAFAATVPEPVGIVAATGLGLRMLARRRRPECRHAH